jgi:hypothetical protein
MTHGFPVYYTPARLLVEGRWSTQVYDLEWFSQQTRAFTNGLIVEKYAPHPPSMTLLALPLAWLDLTTARTLWFLINAALLVGGILLLNSGFKILPGISFGLEITALALLLSPVAENFRLGQAYVLLFFLFALAYRGLVLNQSATVGIALGTAAAFKLSGAPLWLVLAARGRWRDLASSLAVVVLIFIITGFVLGWHTWLYFISIVPAYFGAHPDVSHLAFQTTPSFFQHMFSGDPQWNPVPLFQLPWLATLLTALVTLGVLVFTIFKSRTAPLDLAFSSGLILSVILFPIAEEYHYSLVLFPLAVMAARLVLGPFTWTSLILFAISLILIAAPLPYTSPSLNEGWLALLGYPRLYGGWLLWFLLIRQMLPQESFPPLPVGEG